MKIQIDLDKSGKETSDEPAFIAHFLVDDDWVSCERIDVYSPTLDSFLPATELVKTLDTLYQQIENSAVEKYHAIKDEKGI